MLQKCLASNEKTYEQDYYCHLRYQQYPSSDYNVQAIHLHVCTSNDNQTLEETPQNKVFLQHSSVVPCTTTKHLKGTCALQERQPPKAGMSGAIVWPLGGTQGTAAC